MRVFIIAEAGSNWSAGLRSDQDLPRALDLIRVAAEAGCSAVKFQAFSPTGLYVPRAGQYLGQDVNALLDSLVLPRDWLPILNRECERLGIEFMASVFSPEDADAVDPFVKRHKIASYELGYRDLIEHVAAKGKPIIISTGASYDFEVFRAMATLSNASMAARDVTLLHCVSAYPAPIEQTNLRAMKLVDNSRRFRFGLSDHSRHPTLLPIAATALGASVIEKHFTLSRNLPGPDHAFALEPDELKEMVQAIRRTEAALGNGNKHPQPCEERLRLFARRSVQAARDLPAGTILARSDLAVLRPGNRRRGAEPFDVKAIIGHKLKRSTSEGDGICLEDI